MTVTKCIVRITSKIKHDYLKVWDVFMWVYDIKEDCVQFVLWNWYPTMYPNAKEQFQIEPLSDWFGKEEFSADRGQSNF